MTSTFEDVFDEFELIGAYSTNLSFAWRAGERTISYTTTITATATTATTTATTTHANVRSQKMARTMPEFPENGVGVLDKNGMIQDTSQTDAVPMAIIVERNHSHHMLNN